MTKQEALAQLEEWHHAVVGAEWICDKLKVEYPRMHGRGFQVQVCAEALRKHLGMGA